MTRFERIERARLARAAPDPTLPRPPAPVVTHVTGFRRTDFAVGKLYDDLRFVPTQYNLSRDTAEAVAGRLRDGSTDAQVAVQLAEHWTWGYQALRGSRAAGVKRVAYAAVNELARSLSRVDVRPDGAIVQGRGYGILAPSKPHGGGFGHMPASKRQALSVAGNDARWAKVRAKKNVQP